MKTNKKTYAFIDSQNLNLGVQSAGWKLDFRKFRQYLRQKYNVEEAYLFIGMVSTGASLYANLQKMGYILIFKPTLELPDGNVKGNVDAELVLHAMIQFDNYDKAVIVSGDGDFHCLVEYLADNKKLYKVLTPNEHFSGLLRKYRSYIVRVDQLKHSLEYKPNKKGQERRSTEVLGLPDHRDNKNIANSAKNVKTRMTKKQGSPSKARKYRKDSA